MTFPRPASWFVLSLRRGFSTSRDLIFPVGIVTFLLTAVATPVVALSGVVDSQKDNPSALTQIEVTRPDAAERGSGLVQSQLEEIAKIDNVEDVLPDVGVGIYAADGDTWSLTLRALNPANLPPGITKDDAAAVSRASIIVPDTVDGSDLTPLVGTDVNVSYTRMTGQETGELTDMSLTFAATYHASWQGYGPATALASPDLVIELLAAKAGFSSEDYLKTTGLDAVIVTATSADAVAPVTSALRDLGLTAISVSDTLGELPGVFAIFPQILVVVAIGGILLLLFQLNRAVRGSLERRTAEFGLLRLRAWYPHDVTRLIAIDVCAGSVAGAVVGAAIGGCIGYLLAVGFVSVEGGVPIGRLLVALPALSLAVAAFCAATSLVASRRMLRTDPFLTVMSQQR